MKFLTLAALALMCGSAGAADRASCQTIGDQTWCRGSDGSRASVQRFGDLTFIDSKPGRGGEQRDIRVMKDENGRNCAYEMKGRVPVKLACE